MDQIVVDHVDIDSNKNYNSKKRRYESKEIGPIPEIDNIYKIREKHASVIKQCMDCKVPQSLAKVP